VSKSRGFTGKQIRKIRNGNSSGLKAKLKKKESGPLRRGERKGGSGARGRN